jgi:hypothetical protein
MELRRVRGRITGGTDISDHIAARDRHPFVEPGCVSIQVRVVVAVASRAIEFVNCDASLDAQEEFSNRAVGDCQNGRAARPHDVDGLVTMPVMHLVK